MPAGHSGYYGEEKPCVAIGTNGQIVKDGKPSLLSPRWLTYGMDMDIDLCLMAVSKYALLRRLSISL